MKIWIVVRFGFGCLKNGKISLAQLTFWFRDKQKWNIWGLSCLPIVFQSYCRKQTGAVVEILEFFFVVWEWFCFVFRDLKDWSCHRRKWLVTAVHPGKVWLCPCHRRERKKLLRMELAPIALENLLPLLVPCKLGFDLYSMPWTFIDWIV